MTEPQVLSDAHGTWIPHVPEPKARRAPPSKGRKAAFAAMAVVVLLAASIGTWQAIHTQGSAPSIAMGKHVSVYLTDLPGGYERMRLRFASVGVEDYRLSLPAGELEISAHHGLAEAALVAEGYVPESTRGAIAVLLTGVDGYKEGDWRSIELPRPILVVDNAVVPGDFARNALVIDLDLDASMPTGDLAFEPTVGALYQYVSQDPDAQENPATAGDEFQRVGGVSARALSVAEGRAVVTTLCPGYSDADLVCDSSAPPACAAATGCQEREPGCTADCDVPTPTTAQPATTRLGASSPAPFDGGIVAGKSPTLEWSSPTGAGGAYQFDVLVEGTLVCTTTSTTCRVLSLEERTYHWSVKTTGPQGTVLGPTWTFSVYVPYAPTPADAQLSTMLNAPLRWTGVGNPAVSATYRVLLGTSNPPTQVACAWSTATTCTPKNLVDGTTYRWRVDTHIDGNTAEGPVWSFVAHNAPPTKVNLVSPTNQDAAVPAGAVYLYWDPSSDPEGRAVQYKVSYTHQAGGGSSGWGTDTSYRIAYLPPQASVSWYVEVREADGNQTAGAASSTWSFTTIQQKATP